MAAAKKPLSVSEPQIGTTEKIARVLALILVKGMETEVAALKLDAAGFGSAEIAKLLDVNSNYLAATKFRKKNAVKKAPKK